MLTFINVSLWFHIWRVFSNSSDVSNFFLLIVYIPTPLFPLFKVESFYLPIIVEHHFLMFRGCGVNEECIIHDLYILLLIVSIFFCFSKSQAFFFPPCDVKVFVGLLLWFNFFIFILNVLCFRYSCLYRDNWEIYWTVMFSFLYTVPWHQFLDFSKNLN